MLVRGVANKDTGKEIPVRYEKNRREHAKKHKQNNF